jgi:TPR repeat protein
MEWTAVGNGWQRVMRGTGVLLAVGLVLASADYAEAVSWYRRAAEQESGGWRWASGTRPNEEPDARLTNSVNDARKVAKALRKLDFDEVLLKEDLDREGMEQAVYFIGTLRAGDVAVFYYAVRGRMGWCAGADTA